jgi:hypothetical protein
MTTITPVGTRTFSPQSKQNQDVSALSFLLSKAFAATDRITNDPLAIFKKDKELSVAFVEEFNAVMSDDANRGISPENGAHIALFNTIMENRSLFPAGGFSIKTLLPGGASIETEIPAGSSSAVTAPPQSTGPQASIVSAFLDFTAPSVDGEEHTNVSRGLAYYLLDSEELE